MKTVPSEFVELSKKLHELGTFIKERIHPQVLYQAYLDGFAFVGVNRAGNIILFGVLWKTLDPNQFEMGTFWKDPEYYKEPASELIFNALLRKIPDGSVAFISTKSDSIKKVVSDAGWKVCPDPHKSILATAVEPKRNFGEGRTVYFLQSTP